MTSLKFTAFHTPSYVSNTGLTFQGPPDEPQLRRVQGGAHDSTGHRSQVGQPFHPHLPHFALLASLEHSHSDFNTSVDKYKVNICCHNT